MDPDAYDKLHEEIATTDGMREHSPPDADRPAGSGMTAAARTTL